jgi:glycosyltransferase involved in cell wall biosynthesis
MPVPSESAAQSVAGLRIALLHWCVPPTTGGVESHLADLARLLAETGCQVTMITGEERPELAPGVDAVTTELLNIERIRAGLSKMDGYAERLADRLGGILARRRIRLVHAHQLHHFAPQPALVLDQLRHRLGFRLHHTFHETWPDLLHDTPVYRDWDGNYAVSAFVQGECVRRLGVRPTLLPLGIDTDRFADDARGPAESRPTAPSGFTILHPARLLPWKGVHVSVRALAQLLDRGIAARLLITDTTRIADWKHELVSYRSQILELVRELNLVERVEFVSAPYAQIHVLYRRADVVIYPTIEPEPFGLVPLEAMSTRRPVVASRIGGIMETVVDGVTGYLVEPGDHTALADRLAQLHQQPDLCRRMGDAGRARVVSDFDLRRFMATLLGRYTASLAARPPRA